MKHKPKTAVLYGGNSRERQISCRSGIAVLDALKGRGFNAIGIDVREDFIAVLQDFKVDVAFLALHGSFGEDGQIQTILDEAGIAYSGSGPEASRIAMDKPATKRLLMANNIPTPEFFVTGLTATEDAIADAAETLGYPLVVKPPADGSSLGVSIVQNVRGLAKAVTDVRKYTPAVLIERYISGRELTVSVFNDRALPPIEIRCPGFYDFNAKYNAGRTQYIVNPSLNEVAARAVEEVARGTYMCVGCAGAARVDIRLDDSSLPYVLEVNTIPGLTATSLLPKAAKAAGIGFGELCEMMIEDAVERAAARGGTIGGKKASA